MRFLVIGLGIFGRTLVERLTDNGHEVLGVDSNELRVEEVKERLSVTYILDAVEYITLSTLPLDKIDYNKVCKGKIKKKSLRAVSALKRLKVKHIYARAIDEVHHSILLAMNIDKIFIPERYAARIFADKFLEYGTEPLL